MEKYLVSTVSGNDRPGLVEEITKIIFEHDGNVDASRAVRLGGEFAMLALISVSEQKFDALRERIRALRNAGYKVTTRQTERGASTRYAGWLPYRVKVNGADHEGIIHELTRHLAQFGINIEAMETDMINAPMSGTPLFTMNALVFAPPDLIYQDWRDDLIEAGDLLNVDVDISRHVGDF